MLSLPLFAARVIHFASTVMVAGAVLFPVLVSAPGSRERSDRLGAMLTSLHNQLRVVAWASLAISIVSGAAWLLVLATKITGSSLTQVISNGTVRTFLTRTQFGHAWDVRLVLAMLLVFALLRLKRGWPSTESLITAALAAGFLGALAWSGHGGATPGLRGEIHVAADALHLIAAGAWIGGLLPLGLLLSRAEKMPGGVGISIAHGAAMRFSTLGMTAVATLIITGAVNTWILVGSVHALVESEYGRLLLVKIAIFLVLLAVAAVNRMRLTPRLAATSRGGSNLGRDALRRLKRNCFVETALGLAILIVVGALGTMSPEMDM